MVAMIEPAPPLHAPGYPLEFRVSRDDASQIIGSQKWLPKRGTESKLRAGCFLPGGKRIRNDGGRYTYIDASHICIADDRQRQRQRDLERMKESRNDRRKDFLDRFIDRCEFDDRAATDAIFKLLGPLVEKSDARAMEHYSAGEYGMMHDQYAKSSRLAELLREVESY